MEFISHSSVTTKLLYNILNRVMELNMQKAHTLVKSLTDVEKSEFWKAAF